MEGNARRILEGLWRMVNFACVVIVYPDKTRSICCHKEKSVGYSPYMLARGNAIMYNRERSRMGAAWGKAVYIIKGKLKELRND